MQSHKPRFMSLALASFTAAFAAGAGAASIDVNPAFPAYGQAVSVQLSNAGQDPLFRWTRYQVKGSTIVLELEHNSSGYFGSRTDAGYVPVTLGELAPGRYTIQAKLFDIYTPEAPPSLFTRAVEVLPPEKPGVYTVPRTPGAYEGFQLLVKGDGPVNPSSLRATVTDWTIRVDFEFSQDPSAPAFATVKMAGLRPGAYRVEAVGVTPNYFAVPPRTFTANFNTESTTSVVEYYSPKLDHYVISAWPDEVATLDADPRAAFERTGERFKAWLHAADAPASAVPVCRFYASGPNSHFYTADATECQALKSLEQKQRAEAAAKGQAFSGWQFEAAAFYAVPATGGVCPAGTLPVYRAFNNRAAEGDSNHRFTVSPAMRAAMWTGWAEEGVAFCSPL